MKDKCAELRVKEIKISDLEKMNANNLRSMKIQ